MELTWNKCFLSYIIPQNKANEWGFFLCWNNWTITVGCKKKQIFFLRFNYEVKFVTVFNWYRRKFYVKMKLWKSKKNNTTTNSGPSINCVSGKQSHLNQNNDNKADTATNSSSTTTSGKWFISFSSYWALFIYSLGESDFVVCSMKLTWLFHA